MSGNADFAAAGMADDAMTATESVQAQAVSCDNGFNLLNGPVERIVFHGSQQFLSFAHAWMILAAISDVDVVLRG